MLAIFEYSLVGISIDSIISHQIVFFFFFHLIYKMNNEELEVADGSDSFADPGSDDDLERNERRENRRNVRARSDAPNPFDLIPYDLDDIIPNNWRRLSITQLMDDNVPRKRTFIQLQLIRIVSGSANAGTNNGSSSFNYFNRQRRDRQNTSNYQRMFLFREIHSNIGQVVYMIEGRGQNERLWVRNAELRDNGSITVGCCVCVICPSPIVHQLGNEVPILESRGSLVIYKNPQKFYPIRIDSGLPQNVTRAFVLNGVQIEVESTHAIATRCSGLFCDRQRSRDIVRTNRGCGCYSMQTRLSNIALSHSISVSSEIGDHIFRMEEFSSVQFTRMFLSPTGLFTPTTRINSFENIRKMSELEDHIDQIVEHVNGHGGFSVIGWYKRGEINDQGGTGNAENNDDRVEAGDISFHIVSIRPSHNNVINQITDEMKFDVNTLN